MPRPPKGRVRAERANPRRQPVHTMLVRAPAKKPRVKAVGGGRDPRISASVKDYHRYIHIYSSIVWSPITYQV